MKTNNFISKYIWVVLIIFICLIYALSLRGLAGNPNFSQLQTRNWKENGPFELSPERGRYALMYSVVENHSVFLSRSIAEFTAPDVGFKNGKYVSIFAPLLSYVIIPGYLLGKIFNISQVGAFATISIFALLNFILIRNISIKLGADGLTSTIASTVFIFATPAFAYGVNLYQHHISAFLMLISIYALLRFKNFLSSLIVFLAFGCAIPLDYPNLFFLFPIAFYAGIRTFSLENIKQKLTFRINLLKLISPLIIIFPIMFFLWFNTQSYGSPFQLSGTVENASFKLLNEEENLQANVNVANLSGVKEKEEKGKSAIGFFKTRNLVEGFYIHIISPDRGIIYYTPIILFGVLGALYALKKKVELTALLISVIGVNVLLYSMWGDPWGGWAFGSRYLIPSYAILSIYIALILTYWRRKIWFLALFTIVAIYSIAINTLGAVTTSAIPPQVQVLELEKLSGVIQRYTYQRNWEFLLSGRSKSFMYQEYLYKYMTPMQFYQILTGIIVSVFSILMVYFAISSREGNKNA